MKACFKCKQFKPYDAFYAAPGMRDGVAGKCKECTKADVRANYREHIDKYKEYERGRAMAQHRVEARARHEKTPAGRVTNPYGFDFGCQRVIRLWSHKGATCLRVLNMVTGQYVDVQTSPAGRENYVSVGTLDKDALRRELEQPE